jgi:secretion/DNA translocation related TadE-like protein
VKREAGFVTVAVAGLVLVLVAFSAVVATLGAVAVARHRAAAAADLAALAGAAHVLDGSARACGEARLVASAQSAALSSCRLDGAVVTVEVAVRLGRLGAARARARAGPVDR